MDTKITVIIPLYNVERYLPRLLSSLNTALRHTADANDFDVIFINDGSTDNSLRLLDNRQLPYPLNQVSTVVSQDNEGPSSARNKGLGKARGKWVTFIDADDCIAEDYLASLQEAAANADDTVSFIATGYRTFDDEGNETIYALNTSGDYDSLIASMPTFAWTKLFRMDAIRRGHIQFDPELRAGEDAQFLFDYWAENPGRVMPVDQDGYLYYQRAGSLTKQNRVNYSGKLRDYRNFRKSIRECVAKNRLSDDVWRHWRKMTAHDLYDMVGDLRQSGLTSLQIARTLARDFTADEMNDLRHLTCTPVRGLLNRILLHNVKRARKTLSKHC